jgi:hypothetical protein
MGIPRTIVPIIAVGLLAAGTLAFTTPSVSPTAGPGWRTDRAWDAGPAEWALYDAVRPIYGVDRQYEATLFTNTQRMDPATTVKSDGGGRGSFEVFKHNLSEMIETEHYTYRFVTTCFVRSDTLAPYKVAVSSQEDCGTTYKQFVVADGAVDARQFCYFPGAGASAATYDAPANLAFHDALSLTLRDYDFDAKPRLRVPLMPDQTDTHETGLRPGTATITYVERETVSVPYGEVDAHHLRVTHARDGGTTTTDYWFAADEADMRHVMVKYHGPYGVRYELKRLGWWAYWDRGEGRP